jgi:hypothetical protein
VPPSGPDRSAARHPLEEELLLDTYLRRQRELEESSELPRPEDPLGRLRPQIAVAGAIHVGFLVACFSLFMILVVVNVIFHLEP